jgi:hypothetical protein
MLVLAMKWLPSKGILVRAKIKVRVKQRVKRHLAKRQVAHALVPSRVGTSRDAQIEHAKRSFKLMGEELLNRFEHELPKLRLRRCA